MIFVVCVCPDADVVHLRRQRTHLCRRQSCLTQTSLREWAYVRGKRPAATFEVDQAGGEVSPASLFRMFQGSSPSTRLTGWSAMMPRT